MMLQIKFGCDRPAGLGDIHVWKCGRTHRQTHGLTPARVPSYKLTLWAFGSGELKKQYNTFLRCPSFWPPAPPQGMNPGARTYGREADLSKVPRVQIRMLSDKWLAWRNFNVKLWRKFSKHDRRTNEWMDSRKRYTHRHKCRGIVLIYDINIKYIANYCGLFPVSFQAMRMPTLNYMHAYPVCSSDFQTFNKPNISENRTKCLKPEVFSILRVYCSTETVNSIKKINSIRVIILLYFYVRDWTYTLGPTNNTYVHDFIVEPLRNHGNAITRHDKPNSCHYKYHKIV